MKLFLSLALLMFVLLTMSSLNVCKTDGKQTTCCDEYVESNVTFRSNCVTTLVLGKNCADVQTIEGDKKINTKICV